MEPLEEEPVSSFSLWLPVALWIALLWALVPTGRRLYALFVRALTLRGLELLLYGATLVVVLRALAVLPARSARLGWLRTALALACVVAYLVAVARNTMPEEILHVLEYTPLALFLERALSPRLRPWPRAGVALVLATLVACSDEGLQYFTPNRVCDPADVMADVIGAGLTLAFLRITGLEVSARSGSPP